MPIKTFDIDTATASITEEKTESLGKVSYCNKKNTLLCQKSPHTHTLTNYYCFYPPPDIYTHTHRHTNRVRLSSRISSCLTMTRLVGDRQQILTNLSGPKYGEQTDEEVEMRRNRWADSQTVRQVGTLMPLLIHSTHLTARRMCQTQAVTTSMTLI